MSGYQHHQMDYDPDREESTRVHVAQSQEQARRIAELEAELAATQKTLQLAREAANRDLEMKRTAERVASAALASRRSIALAIAGYRKWFDTPVRKWDRSTPKADTPTEVKP
jgi:hypothetical protein